MLVAVDEVEVATNPQTRESRLFGSTGAYVRRNGLAILRIYARYEPLRVFATRRRSSSASSRSAPGCPSCSTGSSTATPTATSSR